MFSTHTRLLFLHAFTILLFAVSVPAANAQGIPSVGGEINLATSPEYPSAYEEVTVAVESFGLNTTGATISWLRNGVAVPEAKNARSLKITTGPLGSSEVISATISPVGGTPVQKKITLTPTDVDLIIEPETYTPEVYKGGALPSFGASIRAVAMPHLYKNGKALPADDIVYTWFANGKALHGGPSLGKNVAEFNLPLYGATTLSVRAASRDSTVQTERVEVIRATAPKLFFYEETSLFGRSQLANSTFVLPKTDTLIRAEPYYMSRELKGDPSFEYLWKLNGNPARSSASDPFLISINTDGGGIANAHADFSMRSLEHVLQSARGEFDLQFTGVGFDPL